MVEFTISGSRLGFGEQSARGSAASTKNRWLGTQAADWTPPYPEITLGDYRGGGGGRDAYQQNSLSSKFAGNLSVVVQNGYVFLWALGTETIVAGDGTNGAPNGSFIRRIRGGNTQKLVTIHEVLGDTSGNEVAIDWLDVMVEKLSLSVDEEAELVADVDILGGTYDDAASPISVTASTTAPYTFGADWGILNTGSTLATHTNMTGLTQPTALRKWDYSLESQLREIRGGRSTNSHLPITVVPGPRKHTLNMNIVPADKTVWQKLIRDRLPFDAYWRHTRASNDFLEIRWRDCRAMKGPIMWPHEDAERATDLQLQPRTIEIDVVGPDNQSVLLDA